MRERERKKERGKEKKRKRKRHKGRRRDGDRGLKKKKKNLLPPPWFNFYVISHRGCGLSPVGGKSSLPCVMFCLLCLCFRLLAFGRHGVESQKTRTMVRGRMNCSLANRWFASSGCWR